MKKTGIKYTILFVLVLFVISASAGKREIRFSVSETDAKIFVEGKLIGTGQVQIIVPSHSCVTVKVEKASFLTTTIEFCNKPEFTAPPKTFYMQLEKDDSYDATEATDIANVDIEVKTKKSEAEAWKLMSQIITSYFDVIEVTDRETGYLRTSWVAQTFKQRTIRTRMIVKLGSTEPLAYKIKLVSEQAGAAQTSVKSDELFKEWDRVLRKYKEVIREIQTRVGY